MQECLDYNQQALLRTKSMRHFPAITADQRNLIHYQRYWNSMRILHSKTHNDSMNPQNKKQNNSLFFLFLFYFREFWNPEPILGLKPKQIIHILFCVVWVFILFVYCYVSVSGQICFCFVLCLPQCRLWTNVKTAAYLHLKVG